MRTRRLSNRAAVAEARRFKTLTLGRAASSGGVGVAMPQATAQNQMIVASATPDWTLLAAPAAEGQSLIAGVDPYTPVWGTTFPTVMQFDAGVTLGGATGINVITIPDSAAQAVHIVDAGGTEFLRLDTYDDRFLIDPANTGIRIGVGVVDPIYRLQVHTPDVFVAKFIGSHEDWAGCELQATEAGAQPYVQLTNTSDDKVCYHHLNPNTDLWGFWFTDDWMFIAAGGDVTIVQRLLVPEVTFTGITGANVVTVPDNLADAVHIVDDGGIEYLRIISTDAQPVIVLNEGGADVDFRVEAGGLANALFVQGSTGYVALGHDDPYRMLHMVSDTVDTVSAILEEYSSTTHAPDIFLRKGRGTIASPLDVVVDDRLGALYFVGYRNAAWIEATAITSTVTSLGTSVVRGELRFSTADATGSLVRNMTIKEDGDVTIIEDGNATRLSGTKVFAWIIDDPEVGTFGQVRIPWDCTVRRVDANTQGGTSCSVNPEERSTLGSSGTNVLSSDMVADADGESVTSSFNDEALAEGNHLALDISAVSGVVDRVTINLTVTID